MIGPQTIQLRLSHRFQMTLFQPVWNCIRLSLLQFNWYKFTYFRALAQYSLNAAGIGQNFSKSLITFSSAKCSYCCTVSSQFSQPTRDIKASLILFIFFVCGTLRIQSISPLAHFCSISVISSSLKPRKPRKLLPLLSILLQDSPKELFLVFLSLPFSHRCTTAWYSL